MVVVFKIKEINYLTVSLFCDLVRPLSFSCLWYEDFGCYLPCLWHSDKSSYGFPKVIYDFQVGGHQAQLFSTNILSKFSCTKNSNQIYDMVF